MHIRMKLPTPLNTTVLSAALAALHARVFMRQLTALILSAALCLASVPQPARAAGGIQFVRDAEIEALLREYIAPILRVAGVGGGGGKRRSSRCHHVRRPANHAADTAFLPAWPGAGR